MATSGRRENSRASGLVLSSGISATTDCTSANEFDSALELTETDCVSDSRARGASQEGILISSTSSEDGPLFGGGTTLFTGGIACALVFSSVATGVAAIG